MYRQWAFGALLWTPATFADCTIRDLHDGITLFRKINGMDVEPRPTVTRAMLDELKAQYPDKVNGH